MHWEEHKWWNKFEEIALNIIWNKPHYFKEKRGRFDVTVYEWAPDWMFDRIIQEVEIESELCCQECAKHSKQYWTETWWVQHFCLKHYIIFMAWYYKRRFKFLIRKLCGKIK